MDPAATQAKELLGLVGTPSALVGGTFLAFASRGIKDNLAKVDRPKMVFAVLAGVAAMGVTVSLIGLMAPIAFRSLFINRGDVEAVLVVYWMMFLSVAGSFVYAALITKRCIDELKRPAT